MPPCPRCGHPGDPAALYCPACGHARRAAAPAAPDERTCAGCGARLETRFRFCGRCGRPVEGTVAEAPPRASATPVPGALDVRDLLAAMPRGRALRLVPVRQDGLPGEVRALGPEPLVCGRSSGALRFADDATVSPEHARFMVRGGEAVVEDLGSANGTFLRLRAPRALRAGDELRLGRQLLRCETFPQPVESAGTRPWGSADPGYRARLVQLLDGGGTGEVFPLRTGENAVGREVGHVSFPADRYVSARHARVDVTGASVVVADVGSSNGTFVRVTGPTPVQAGDQLLIGMQLLRIEA
jgi:pSer/pThr/pTyr-binding forkhead associated (FHA) protein